jgi:hypothetical protein
MRFNERPSMTRFRPPHPFRDAGAVADTLDRHPQCDGEATLLCQQELHTQGFLSVCTGTNPEDSNLAWSVERGGHAVGPPLPIPRS